MTLKDQITEDMKNAMRAKETARLNTIRLLLAAIKQREVDERIVVDDAGVVAIVEKLIKQIEKLTEEDMLICSGSTCYGQDDAYQRIAELCEQKKIQYIMDVPGKEILDFIDKKPFLIKPNLQELETYFDIKIKSMKDLILYGKKLVDMGASNVLVSMGSKGSILLDKDHIYRANQIHGHVTNTTGAGDSMIAGFVSSFVQNKDIKKSYLYAVSSGTATVFGEGLATIETCTAYQDKIKIKEIHS